MDPQTMLLIGVGVLCVAQLVAAITVMRAAAEREDLEGMSRLMPVFLTLIIPIFGPFIGGRATGAGMRPMLISLVGTLIFGGLYLAGPGAGMAKPQQMAQQPPGQPAQPAAGQPAQPAAGQPAQPAEAPGQPAAKPAQQPKPAAQPAAKPAPQPEPTPQPAAKPAAATAEMAPQPKPAAEMSPAPAANVSITPGTAMAETPGDPAAMAVPQPAGKPVSERLPSDAMMSRRVQVTGQILLSPTESGGVMEAQLAASRYTNIRLTFAASYTTPPRGYVGPLAMGGTAQQLYLGGKVWYFDTLADYFPPYPLSDAEVTDGQTVLMASARGNYLAEVKFTGVQTNDEGHVIGAALDVNVR